MEKRPKQRMDGTWEGSMIKPEPKMFTCECGYAGIRWDDNNICKNKIYEDDEWKTCGKEGKLTEMTRDSREVLEW